MAEKEERIEQFITIQQRTITTRDYETNDEIISKIYPRTEAIDKISRALFKHEAPSHLIYDNMSEGYLATFKKRAEIALETILE